MPDGGCPVVPAPAATAVSPGGSRADLSGQDAAVWVTVVTRRIDGGRVRLRTVQEILRGHTIQSGRETWLDDAAATPRPRVRVLMPGAMEAAMSVGGMFVGVQRRHVDLLRTASAGCRG